MAWKTDEKGNLIVSDGNPVWIDGSGAEIAADYGAATVKIATLNRENGEHRTARKEAETKLAAFSGIEDPAAALKAMQFAASMEGKKVMDDEGIQNLIKAAVKPLQVENETLKNGLSERDATIYKQNVSNQFHASPFVKEKLLVPPDMLEATFGKHFKMDGGKMVATDATGNQIFNLKGEPANFEEAIRALVDSHPMKDNLYRATGGQGSGQQQSSGAQSHADKFAHLKPTDRITAARESGLTT